MNAVVMPWQSHSLHVKMCLLVSNKEYHEVREAVGERTLHDAKSQRPKGGREGTNVVGAMGWSRHLTYVINDMCAL